MADEPENHTLRLLQEMRQEMREGFDGVNARIERIGENPDNLSRLMTELASINANRREKRGREVRYFLNPHIATHLPRPTARAAAREGAGPLLRSVEGGRSDG